MDKIKGFLLDLMSTLNKFMLFLAWTIVIIYITWNFIKLIKRYVLNKALSSKGKAVIVTGKF